MTNLTGKVALVTGASKGLGKSMAEALGRAGAQCILASRDAGLLEVVEKTIRAEGGAATSHECDVLSEASVAALRDRVAGQYGKIHILINNAGVNVRKPVTEFTMDEWRRVIDTNLTGAFLMCRDFVPLMTGQGYGRIINLTSIMSHVALPHRAAYAASKAGLLGFTKALALELAPERITVNGISPGPIATEMNRPIIENPEANKQFISRIPIGGWGRVEDIGALALYLCSDAASFMTGTDLVIDGGWTAQ